jgi:hypothetical protein
MFVGGFGQHLHDHVGIGISPSGMRRKNRLADRELGLHGKLRSATCDRLEPWIILPLSLYASQKNIDPNPTLNEHDGGWSLISSRCRRPIPGQALSSTLARPQPQPPAAWHGEQHEPPRSKPTAAPVTWDEYVSGVPADAGTVERNGCSEELTNVDDERLWAWPRSTLATTSTYIYGCGSASPFDHVIEVRWRFDPLPGQAHHPASKPQPRRLPWLRTTTMLP